MALPTSFNTKLRKVQKSLQRAEREFQRNKDSAALASDVTDALILLHLLLDRAQNEVWKKLNSKRAESRKPNIYFPLCSSREGFCERLQKDQVPDLEAKNAKVFEIIEALQPYNGVSRWWENLHKISSNRHERDASVAKVEMVTGFGFGKGQNLHVRKMKIEGGKVYFDGDATSQKTGKKEPLRVDPVTEDIFLLEDLDVEPIKFAEHCLARTRETLSKLFNALK